MKKIFITTILQAWTWFKKTFVSHTESAASVAVTITEAAKVLLSSPAVGVLENLADIVFHTQLPTVIATAINNQIPKILAVELAIQGLPDNPNQAQILAFEQEVATAFNVKLDKSKLYTVFSSQIYGIIKEKLSDGKLTFAEGVDAVEKAWEAYQQDLKDNATTGIIDLPVGTVLSNGNIIVESASDALKEAV